MRQSRILTKDLQNRKVWISAIPINILGLGFSGANMALTADVSFPDQLRLPRNSEHLEMLISVLTKAGSRFQDEIHTLQVYFMEVIRLFSSLFDPVWW